MKANKKTAGLDLKNDKRVVSNYRSLLRVVRKALKEHELKEFRKAFNMALEACGPEDVKLGELTIFHAMEVCRIVTVEMGLGRRSLMSALLYDFVVNDRINLVAVEKNFGPEIRTIVEGLAKISQVDAEAARDHADNLRALLLTMASDIRVILVKLADRLYYMRNLDHATEEDRFRILSEVSIIYAPLAHRLGLYAMKSEMEDLVFKYSDPESYRYITKRLRETKAARDRFIREFIKPVKDQLVKAGFQFDIKGRTKSVYSIWQKMQKQNVDFDEVYDLFAIRIILESPGDNEKADCWKTYSLVTELYQPNPNRLRDWISVPKSNGYEALHTTVVVPGGKWVEVQIRSRRMDEIAEQGLAAHWRYKSGESNRQRGLDNWLNRVREILESPEESVADFIDEFKLSLYSDEVFVFTPKGEVKKFPLGATVVDFAFDIHTDIGASCIGAKVNGKNVPIRYKLENGDRVEIQTGKNQTPKQDWLNFVATSKARSKIKQYLREERLKEAEEGKEVLKRRFKNWKVEFNDSNVRKVMQHFKQKTAADLYYLIATQKIDLKDVKNLFGSEEDEYVKQPDRIDEDAVERLVEHSTPIKDDILIIDEQLANIEYRLARCCNPIHGDEIFGFVTSGKGITIHRRNCPNARDLLTKYSYRVVRARWSKAGDKPLFPVSLRVTGMDEMGIVSRLSEVISNDLRVNMRSISIESNEGLFEGTLTLFVRNTTHLDTLIRQMKKVKGVISVTRTD